MSRFQFQLQQPSKLEHLATVTLAEWITLHAEPFMAKISNSHSYDAANKAEDSLSKQIETIRNYLIYMPGKIKSKLLTVLMKCLWDLLDNLFRTESWEDLTEPSHRRHVTARMLEVLFTKNVTYLSLNHEEIASFGAAFTNNSSMLPGLTDLILDFAIEYPDASNMESVIIGFLKEFRRIKSLAVKNCTDKILRCIVDNCKLLEKLDLNNYFLCNNSTIDLLTRLPHLEHLDLNESSVNAYGESEYRKIDRRKRQVLQNIAVRKQFRLYSYVDYGGTSEELQPVFEKHPLIHKLILERTSDDMTLQGHLEVLKNLQDLRELEIYSYDFYSGKVKEVLEAVGSRVQKLLFLIVTEIDLNALKHISVMCPNLQELSIHGGTSEKETVVDELPYVEVQPFRNLQTLNLFIALEPMGDFNDDFLIFLLSNCPKIEFIETQNSYITEDIILKVLDINPLSCLKKLSLSFEVSKALIDRIVENCDSPEVIIYD